MLQKSDSARTTPSNNLDIDYEDAIGHLHGDSEFSGPITKRRCTDVSFLIFLLVFSFFFREKINSYHLFIATGTFVSSNFIHILCKVRNLKYIHLNKKV